MERDFAIRCRLARALVVFVFDFSLSISNASWVERFILCSRPHKASYRWPLTGCPVRNRWGAKSAHCIKWKPFRDRFDAKWTTIYLTVQTTCVVDADAHCSWTIKAIAKCKCFECDEKCESRGHTHTSVSQKWAAKHVHHSHSSHEHWQRRATRQLGNWATQKIQLT